MTLSIICGRGGVRALSTKRSPESPGQAGLTNTPKTSPSEDAFHGLLSPGDFEMKLRGHKKYLREICEKVDQDLSSPTCRKLREHLSSCPLCSAYYDSLKETILLYRKYDEKLHGSRVKKILSHIQELEATETRSKRGKRPGKK